MTLREGQALAAESGYDQKNMTKRDRLLKRMRRNPRTVSMRELQTVLESVRFGLDRISGSHYVFVGEIEGKEITLVIPFRRPHIKAGYVREVLAIIDQIMLDEEVADDDKEEDS